MRVGSYLVMATATRGIDRLLELQELDLGTDRLQARLELLESGEDVQRAKERLAAAEVSLGEYRLQLDEESREQRRLEGDVDAFEQRIAAENKRLYDGSVANAKELESIQAEITGIRGRKTRLEDQLLELMERREELEAGVAERERELGEARAAVEAVQGSTAAELAGIEKDLGERATRRDELRVAFDEELLELYEDLRRQKKRVGAAALVDGVCQGCHQKLSAVELDRLKREAGVRRCDYCRRILVFD